jgi:hypothetical protein
MNKLKKELFVGREREEIKEEAKRGMWAISLLY